ncbi:hypothetical protein LXT21_43900 [Myxococcus sp. K38C18041901]|uniref:hypothetical protein n=1 Tax=Myxococcus guangdongensis TaxID=2906760 RepID=UPI0020A76897|nr:hypothetical protein [Myxococcus guangdongensis]MCP3065734.1 hypothetical protein [Myxococcus guangdongensis]
MSWFPVEDDSMKNGMHWLPAALFALSLVVAPSVAKAQSCVNRTSGDGLAIAAMTRVVDSAGAAFELSLNAINEGRPVLPEEALSSLLSAHLDAIRLNAILPVVTSGSDFEDIFSAVARLAAEIDSTTTLLISKKDSISGVLRHSVAQGLVIIGRVASTVSQLPPLCPR